MNYSKKLKEKQKKILLGGTLSVLIIIMLILVIKLAGFSTPINTLANIKNYISKVFSGDQINLVDNSISDDTTGRLENTDTETYIYTAQDFVGFRDDVNEGNSYAGKTVYLMNDIDLSEFCSEESGNSFEPIGTYVDEAENAVYFSGIFDGNYHTIDNLYMNSSSYQCMGIFTQTTENAIVKNLVLSNICIKNTYSSQIISRTGGIVGFSYGTILNCGIESGTINATYTGTNGERTCVAGISGTTVSKISGCYNRAQISGIGLSGGTNNELYVAGIAGFVEGNCYIEDCYNAGEIKGTSMGNVLGGIIGRSNATSGAIMKNLYNSGEIISNGTGLAIGGIKGMNEESATINLSNCYYLENTAIYVEYYWNGRGYVPGSQSGITNAETLKTYASTLGPAFENDDWNINGGYPILWWEAPTVELNKKQAYINKGAGLQLSIEGVKCVHQIEDLQNISVADFDWESSNKDVATVNSNALVTGVSEGYTTIYGKYNDEQGRELYTECTVYVAGEGQIATPQIETGENFTTILKADGTVWTIGNNASGQLGVGEQGEDIFDVGEGTAEAKQVKINENDYLTNVVKIAVGSKHVLALTKNGEVYSWGDNTYGQLGRTIENSADQNLEAEDTSENSTEQDALYAIKVSGEGGTGTLSKIVDISAGNQGSSAVNEFGWVYAWGNGTNGEMGNGTTTATNNFPVKTVLNTGITVSTGAGHNVAISQSGKAFAWGRNTNGELGIGSTENSTTVLRIANKITEISASGHQTILKDIEGKVYGAGQNDLGQLGIETVGNITNITEINIGAISNPPTEETDQSTLGTTIALENSADNSNVPTVKYIKAGATTTTILLDNGTIYTVGTNTNGELGNGDNTNSSEFVTGMRNCTGTLNKTVTDDTLPKQLEDVLIMGRSNGETESLNTAVILKNGDIYTTGSNESGQIGNNTKISTTYYERMAYARLEYENKTVELDKNEQYQIERDKLKYVQNVENVYDNPESLTVGQNLKYTVYDETYATVDGNGKITSKEGVSGSTKLKIEDLDNGYETYIVVIVCKLENTDTVTYIYDAQDLIEFRDSVNAGNSYAGKTVHVMADIDLIDVCSPTIGSFEPIGVSTDEKGTTIYISFAGTFDGNYHTISNLYMNSGKYNKEALFLANAKNSVIQNLILSDIYIKNTFSVHDTSTVVAGISIENNGTIQNCGIESGTIFAKRTAEVSGSLYRHAMATGIAVFSYGEINSCYNKANIIVENVVTTKGASNAAGILGQAGYGNRVLNCYNTGKITATANYNMISGIIADTWDYGDGNIISNCYNIGTLQNGGGTNVYKAGIKGRGSNGGIPSNCYCVTENVYSYNYNNMKSYSTAGVVAKEKIKDLAPTLGSAYENDDWGINDGYPILWWQAPTVELNKKQAYIEEGEETQLNIVKNDTVVEILGTDVNVQDFDWTSSNEDIATVDSDAKIRGLKEGYTTIYGKYTSDEGKELYAMCIVNVAPKDEKAMSQIETGENITAILKPDGTVWTIGNNANGELGIGEQGGDIFDVGERIAEAKQVKINENDYLTDVVKIAVGSKHILALTKNEEVYAWGDNTYGQLGRSERNSRKRKQFRF